MTQSLALPFGTNLHTDKGLAAYIRTVNALPVLSAREERALARRYRQHNDLAAARELVVANLRQVVHIARGFSGYGLPQADLIQEGNIGLMKAVKHYDPDHGARLLSFAVHWIRAEIYEFVLRNWRIVKVATTKAQRKLFFNLRKSRRRIGWMTRDESDTLAKELGVPVETVQEMEGRMGHGDIPFDHDEDDDDTDFRPAPAGYLQDMRFNPEVMYTRATSEQDRGARLTTALAGLDERSRDIIRRRFLDERKPTLHDLAAEYGISAERVRQIEARALAHMRDAIEVNG